MAHFAAQADVTLIAEGIETEAERRTLRTLGVSLGQGYLFGRPAPADELARPTTRASLLAPR
jgi:EAL domain-containing protein (putative c-di-GMP-specific phosphodiesterase class I)